MTAGCRHLAFARFCISSVLQSQIVILSWVLYQQSQDPMILAWLGLAEAIPAIAFGFIAGPVVDRVRPFVSYALAYIGLGAIFIFVTRLAQGSVSDLEWFAILAGVSLSGAVRSFLGPSVFVMLPRMAGSSLPAAIAFQQSVLQVASVLAPAGMGLILGFSDIKAASFVGLGVFIVGFYFVVRLAKSVLAISPSSKERFTPSDLTVGFQYIWGHPVLRPAVMLDLVAVLFGGAIAILPAFTIEVLGAGPDVLGLLRAAPGAGAILIGVYLSIRPLKDPNLTNLIWAVAGFGVATVGLGFSNIFIGALVALFMTGFFDAISANIRHLLLQSLTPPHLRGRVGSVAQIFITSSNEIGAFESGLAARLMGTSTSILFGGAMTLLSVGYAVPFRIVAPKPRENESATDNESPHFSPV